MNQVLEDIFGIDVTSLILPYLSGNCFFCGDYHHNIKLCNRCGLPTCNKCIEAFLGIRYYFYNKEHCCDDCLINRMLEGTIN